MAWMRALDLVFRTRQAGKDQDRRCDLGNTQLAQHVVTVHIRQVEIQHDQVVIVQFPEVDTLFAEIGCVDVEAVLLEHQFNALRHGAVVFNQQNSHYIPRRRSG